jgi:catechol 2,3-dioxygenase-like lactoylglutathione lyase family enzyme
MTVTGPDFVALQVRDLEAAARFYTERLGLRRAPGSPPGAVVAAAGQPLETAFPVEGPGRPPACACVSTQAARNARVLSRPAFSNTMSSSG